MRAYGTDLRRIIAAGTRNRLSSFASGAAVTALLQSSTATALLCVSFAKNGMITLVASLAVMIGADVSTTLVAQILSLDLSWLSPALIIIGVLTYLTNERKGFRRHIARIFIGLGLMLLSLSLIREAAMPLRESETLPLILQPLENDPVLAILVAALITWIIHSSLASVLLFASLATNGTIDIELGLLLVLGANLGGALVPFATTYKDGPAARQITGGNLFMRITVILIAIPLLPFVLELISGWSTGVAQQIIHLHTAFNIALAIIFLPLIKPVSIVCKKIFPNEKMSKDKNQPLYLDDKALETPAIALAGAARETLRIAELVEEMLEKTIIAFEENDSDVVEDIRNADHQVDNLYNAIKLYMTRLSEESMDTKEADRYVQILTFSTNLEHIGDIIDKSLMDLAEKKIESQESFSKDGFSEIKHFHDRVLENMRLAQAIFMSEDHELAAQLVEKKASVRIAANQTSLQHFRRLQERKSETLATSSLHLDIIRDYRRINSYATRVAFAILESRSPNDGGLQTA
jgi:phosphate:Na+ symporter